MRRQSSHLQQFSSSLGSESQTFPRQALSSCIPGAKPDNFGGWTGFHNGAASVFCHCSKQHCCLCRRLMRSWKAESLSWRDTQESSSNLITMTMTWMTGDHYYLGPATMLPTHRNNASKPCSTKTKVCLHSWKSLCLQGVKASWHQHSVPSEASSVRSPATFCFGLMLCYNAWNIEFLVYSSQDRGGNLFCHRWHHIDRGGHILHLLPIRFDR